MTQVQNKKCLDVNEVAAAVEANQAIVENTKAEALAAADQATQAHTRVGGGSGLRATLVKHVTEALKERESYSMVALKVYCATVMKCERTKKFDKEVYEAVFQHSNACGNANKPKEEIFVRNDDGTYSLKK